MSFKLAKNATSHTKIQSCYPELDLKGQRVAIVGLGKLGSAATKLAFARGTSVITVDQNENLGSIFKLNGWLDEKDGDLKTIFGNFDNKYLKEADIVVVSHGVPLQNYGLISIISSGKQILSELDFAAQVIPTCTKIIDVTGTNGKSTVATFAGQMFNHLGFEIFIGGNLGVPLSEAALECLTWSHQRPLQVVVVEVSSYQLEIPLKYFCPSVVVILNLTPDHLERHQTVWNYAATKGQIFSHMRGNKIGILPLVGKHNYANAAVAALLVIGLDIEIKAAALSSTISKLRTLPHRMQVVHTDSDELADDSKATNVEATYSGLIGFEQKSVLLLGGLAKEVKMKAYHGFEQLVEPLRHHRGVITGMPLDRVLVVLDLTSSEILSIEGGSFRSLLSHQSDHLFHILQVTSSSKMDYFTL
ncbi:hypothetical protein K7X08_000937 [Anisodus acutangulus]|uniref:Mur ligase central domain-containing protein n=1 Tax=Anisodus acutangulus TaxID=402998 RepID=A0A9Q1MMS9_9SOLA|nr:hypothetical protein K7X08_000937 [Anisodus acutangulus]